MSDALRAACTNIAITPALVVHASLGLCPVAGGMTIDEGMSLADRALYDAKAANRRRIQAPQAVSPTRQRRVGDLD